MSLKKKLGILASAALTINMFASTLVFASPVSTKYITPVSTPYGTMNGQVSVDCDNGYWSAQTSCSGTAPTIYVSGSCQYRSTGSVISSDKNTLYNTNYVSATNTTYPSFSVTVFSTHEIRGTSSYTKYTSVSQTL